MNEKLFITLQDLPNVDSSLDEQDSHYFLSNYQILNPMHYRYSTQKNEFKLMHMMIDAFSKSLGKIKSEDSSLYSPTPLGTLRYLMLQDGSWSYYDTVKRKEGFVVEGAYWNNGLFYHVRTDQQNYSVLEMVLIIDTLTKTMNRFPDTYDNLR